MKRVTIAASAIGLIAAVGLLAWQVWQPAPVALGHFASCQDYNGRPDGWPGDAHAGMVQLTSGTFTPGIEDGYPDERPFGEVSVEAFWIDRTEVTRAQFADFVAATGYVTEAERGDSGVLFTGFGESATGNTRLPWWQIVPGANWRYPDGPDKSSSTAADNMPVRLVTLVDARAYAAWRGNELPTEAEWEYAAQAGAASQRLGEEPVDHQGRPTANYWQGVFPMYDAGEDGIAGVAPVGCFASNAYGLYDMIGNLWEWTSDPQMAPLFSHVNGDPGSLRHAEGSRPYVIKGGSYLCAASYCARYRTAARERQEADLATSHVGFRTVRRAPKAP